MNTFRLSIVMLMTYTLSSVLGANNTSRIEAVVDPLARFRIGSQRYSQM